MKTLYILAIGLLLSKSSISQCSVATQVYEDCMHNCYGSANVISSIGNAPFSYSWTNGDIGTSANYLCADSTYIVTMTDANACIAYDTILMSTGLQYTSSIVSNASCQTCCDGTDTMNVSYATTCGPLMYQWIGPNGDQFPTPLNYRTTLCYGSYTVSITDQCGCGGTYICNVGYNSPTGIDQPEENVPSIISEGNQLHISSADQLGLIQVFDLQGRMLFEKEETGNELRIELSDFSASAILVVVSNAKNRTQKIILRE